MDFKQPTEAFLRGIDIHELLPQQEPFVMISRLTHFDMVRTVTETEVSAQNIFVEDGHFTASGLIENIAQTCAARMGYINSYIIKDKVKLGFIGAIKRLEILRPARKGEVLSTSIEVMQEVGAVTMVNATVKVGEETLVTAEMKIALSDIDATK